MGFGHPIIHTHLLEHSFCLFQKGLPLAQNLPTSTNMLNAVQEKASIRYTVAQTIQPAFAFFRARR